MIYSEFGTPLALLSKTENKVVQAMATGSPDPHEYALGDLKAYEGMVEIDAAVARLPLKVFENKSGRRRSPF